KHRSSEYVRIDLVKHVILLRNSAGIDHARDPHALVAHAVEDHARMKRRTFDRCEQFILRGALQIPAKRDAAQVRIYEDGAIAIVPRHPQETGLSGAIFLEPLT